MRKRAQVLSRVVTVDEEQSVCLQDDPVLLKGLNHLIPLCGTQLLQLVTGVATDRGGRLEVGGVSAGREVKVADDSPRCFVAALQWGQ